MQIEGNYATEEAPVILSFSHPVPTVSRRLRGRGGKTPFFPVALADSRGLEDHPPVQFLTLIILTRETFRAIGDEHGLLLVFQRGRNMSLGFGEPRGADVFPTEARIRGETTTKYEVPDFPYEITVR